MLTGSDDPATRAIALYVEGIRESGRLLAAARSAHAAGKPVALQCQNRSVIWGGGARPAAVAHPLLVRGSEPRIPIHGRIYWLRRACDDAKGQRHWSAKIQRAVTVPQATLRKGLQALLDLAGSAAEPLRDVLGLDDSEAEGDGDDRAAD